MLFDEKQPLHSLKPEELESLCETEDIDFPDIAEPDINDKSKANILSSGLVIIQTAWFMLQCIERTVHSLPLTKLELVTMALAIYTVALYGIWWNKPLDVNCPVVVHRKPRRSESGTGEGGSRQDDCDSGQADNAKLLGESKPAVKRANARNGAWVTIWDRASSRASLFVSTGSFDNSTETGATRVPTSYAGELANNEDWLAFLVVAIFATIFGVIHCIAWQYGSPSYMELLLWRTSSVAIACIPVLPMLLTLTRAAKLITMQALVTVPLLLVFSILYVLARFTLLALAFASMRSSPPRAYEVICGSWTQYMPHL